MYHFKTPSWDIISHPLCAHLQSWPQSFVPEPCQVRTSVTDPWAHCNRCQRRFLLLRGQTCASTLGWARKRGDRGRRRSRGVSVRLKMDNLRSWLSHAIDRESWVTFTFESMRRVVRGNSYACRTHTFINMGIFFPQTCFQGSNLNIQHCSTADLAIKQDQSFLGLLACL